MARARESTHLLQSSDVQNREIVREHVHSTIAQTLSTSYGLMCFRFSVSASKLISSLLVLWIHERSLEDSRSIVVLVGLLLDCLNLGVQLFRIPYIKRIRGGEDIEEPAGLLFLLKLAVLLYIVWMIPANVVFWTCSSCFEETPALSGLLLALLVISYLYLLAPAIVLICVCACLPISIVFLMVITSSTQEPATERMLDELSAHKYSSEKFTGEHACSICANDYESHDMVVALHCKHFFHEDCLKTWLRINSSCPICRSYPFVIQE